MSTTESNTGPLFLQCPICKLKTVNLAEMWGEIIFMFTEYSKMLFLFVTHATRAERTSAESVVILWICKLSRTVSLHSLRSLFLYTGITHAIICQLPGIRLLFIVT